MAIEVGGTGTRVTDMGATSGNNNADDPMSDATAKYSPAGFANPADFCAYAVKEFTSDAAYDKENREAALDDLKFVGLDQWDPDVRAARQRQGRPCLTVNVMPQFIGQVIGERRLNETAIKVSPRKDATVAMANTRGDIIKSIEEFSRAKRVYDNALEAQVTCGISNFRIVMDYAENDAFEQDLFIKHIPNPLAVVWDRMGVDITGKDARHCFVQDTMPRNVYDATFPDNPCPGEMGDDMTQTSFSAGWFDKDIVRVTEFWRMIEKIRELCLYADGSVVDVTDMDPADYMPLAYRDKTGKAKIRRAPKTYAQMHLITSFDILEGPYELPLTRLPIIKVTGREVQVGEDRVRYGLIRFAKDAQRMRNYWRSVMVETLAMAPKNQWLAEHKAVKGREDEFRDAHLSGDPLLVFNDGAEPPQRQMPPPIPAAVLQEIQMNVQDIKDTTGLQDASLGMRSNEISGRAIQARKQEGDVATIIFHDNLNESISEGGDVLNQLLGICYDTTRVLRAIGADTKHRSVTVNDPNDPDSIDLTQGKYDTSIETGPSFTTAREQAADAMMQAIQVAPQLMQIAGDLIVKNQDWPGAQEIADRLKKTIPPQLLDPADMSPEEQAAAQQQQQQGQGAQAVQMAEMAKQSQHADSLRQIELAQKEAEMYTAQANAKAAGAKADEAGHRERQASADADNAEANAIASHAQAHEAGVHDRAASLHHLQDLHHAHEEHQGGQRRQDEQSRAAVKHKSQRPAAGQSGRRPAAKKGTNK